MAERESPYLWSTTALTNAAADPNINFAEGQLPSTLNNSNRSVMAAQARFLKDTDGGLTTAGSANAYTLTINGTQTAYAAGQIYGFQASFTNTGATTLNITNADATAIGAKAIRVTLQGGEQALSAGMMTLGGRYLVMYDPNANGSAGAFLLLNPSLFQHSALSNYLTANLAVSSAAYTNGASVAQGTAGTWLATGQVTFLDTNAVANNLSAKMWDGTTVLAATSQIRVVAGGYTTFALVGAISSPAGDIRIACLALNSTTNMTSTNANGDIHATGITVVRVA